MTTRGCFKDSVFCPMHIAVVRRDGPGARQTDTARIDDARVAVTAQHRAMCMSARPNRGVAPVEHPVQIVIGRCCDDHIIE